MVLKTGSLVGIENTYRYSDDVFKQADVQVVWHECSEFASTRGSAPGSVLIVRLRTDIVPTKSNFSSLNTMGRAFLRNGSGNVADA
jgi:hypothetical protein